MTLLDIHGATYGDNFGDVLIHNILANELAQRGVATRWPLSAKKFRNHQKALGWAPRTPRLTPSVGLVFGPGGYLSYEKDAVSFAKHSAWNRRFYGYHLPALLSANGVGKTAFFGLEIGPVPGRVPNAMIHAAVESAQLVAVRTPASARWLMETWGVNASVIPDVALYLRPPSGDARESGVSALLHVGDARLWRTDARVQETLHRLSKDFDSEIITDTSRLMRATWNAIEDAESRSRLRPYFGAGELLRKIAHAQVVVTTKLHVSICAYALGVPVVQLAQHPKTLRFNAATDSQGQALQPFQEFAPEDLPDLIAAASASSQSPLWAENRRKERERLSEAFDALSSAVAGCQNGY